MRVGLILLVCFMLLIFFVIIFYLFWQKKKQGSKFSLFESLSLGSFKDFLNEVRPLRFKSREDAKKVLDKVLESEESGSIKEFHIDKDKKLDARKKEESEKIKKLKKNKLKIKKGEREKLLEKTNKENEKQGGKIPLNKAKSFIRIANFQDLFNRVKDKEAKKILSYFKDKDDSLMLEKFLKRNFASEKELIDYLKEGVINFLKENHIDLKDRISEFRKKGIDVTNLSLKIMAIPLKIKLFASSFSKKDFDKVIKLLDFIQADVDNLESGQKDLIKKEKLKKVLKQKADTVVKGLN